MIFRTFRKPHSLKHFLKAAATRIIQRDAARHYKRLGHKTAIFAHDLIGISINSYGVYERDSLEALFGLLAPLAPIFSEGLALDIGANIGNHTMYFAERFGRVYAFEPNPSTYLLLKFNSGFYTNVQSFEFGLGCRAGAALINDVAGNTGAAFLKAVDETEQGSEGRVRVEVLDQLDLDFHQLCFMKMDVEGFEPDVVRGARKLIALYQPIIAFEQQKSAFSDSTSPTIQALKELGYTFIWNKHCDDHRGIFARLKRLFRGQVITFVSGEAVPEGNHDIIIAVSKKYKAALEL